MQRIAIAAVLVVPLTACGQEARRQAEELQARVAAAETALADAHKAADEQKVELDASTARLLGVSTAVRDELLAAARPGIAGQELVQRAESILWIVDDHADFLDQTLTGRRIMVESRGQAALLLARSRLGYDERARELAQGAVALAQSAADAAPEDRAAQALLGDAYAGSARIERERGDVKAAIQTFERAVELLAASDKGRGDGTGSSENRGESAGGGKGRGRGKGRNKAQSLLVKQHLCNVYAELADAYRADSQFEQEVGTITRERHVQASICQVQSGLGGHGYLVARVGMAELIDRLGDATERYGDPADAVKVEQLSLGILRELAEEKPAEVAFTERLVPQGVEIAERCAALGQLEVLRATVVQAFEDLKVLENLGTPRASMRADEARLSLAMARGLTAGAEGASAGTDGYLAEAANWYGRAVESLDSLRVDGVLPAELAPLEEAALLGIEKLQSGG